MKKIKETDLFLPVKELFIKNGFSVDGEVNDCDVVAKKEELIVIVELKTSITLELILQAIKRQRMSEYVYIGIPRLKVMSKRKWKDYLLLIQRLGLGLIVVTYDKADVIVEPGMFDLIKSLRQGKKKKEKLVLEFNGRNLDTNIGGSTRRKIMTAYKDKSLYIACCLQLYGPLSPKQLKNYGSCKKKTNSILIKNFNHWFHRVRKGVYELTADGEDALKQYKDISSIHKKKIQKLVQDLDK